MAFSVSKDIRVVSAFWALNLFVCLFFGFSSVNAWAEQKKFVPPTILVVGDSLSAAFGIDQAEGWVQLLQNRLSTRYYHANVVNASISGETTQGGLSRIAALLDKHTPDIVILELGGNDGLRGLPLTLMKDNLDRILQIISSRSIKILLLGIQLPPNYGKFYTQQFQKTYDLLAQKYQVPLVPFLLDGIATNPTLMQEDGIHPRAEAQRMVLDNVWPHLKPMIPRKQLK
ncbi:arylesterase [Kaarinaea lacus]